MRGRFDDLEREYESVLISLSDPEVISDPGKLRKLSRRHKELEAVVMAARELRGLEEDLTAAREMLTDSSGPDREIMRTEVEATELAIGKAQTKLESLLVPKDPNDSKRVIVEIRGAEGGEEANLFARDLFEMYARYADRMSWRLEVLGSDLSERDGFNEITFILDGLGAWARMKYEGGTHRVQRVPVTESQGRIHTSSATVTVLPEVEEVEVAIDDKDLKVDIYRSTGPGGQSVNTTDSAVRVTHLPTGIVVAMQDERSQLQNRAKAMQVLRARLAQFEKDRHSAELSAQRRSQVGGGGRSEKIRTYNYKENRVTDHRIGLSVHRLDRILLGELDEVSEALLADERARQLSAGK